jgi:hypothetical protein
MNNITKSKEKLTYLINMMLKENDFEVLGLDISVDTYTPKTTTKEEPQPIVELYDIFLSVDYLREIPSFNDGEFTNKISKVLSKIEKCVTEFTITSEGKLVRGEGDMSFSSRILSFNFVEEEKSIFEITYHFLNRNT